MKYSKDIYSKQGAVLQIISVHWKLISKLPKASEWKRSGEEERPGVTVVKRTGKSILPRAKVVSALRFLRAVALAAGQAPAETRQAGHTNGIN